MHNNTTYTAKFRDLIMTAFGKEQVIRWSGDVTVFQVRDCPELWQADPMISTGRQPWQAATARDLIVLIEGDFVERVTDWHEQPGMNYQRRFVRKRNLPAAAPNVIPFRRKTA